MNEINEIMKSQQAIGLAQNGRPPEPGADGVDSLDSASTMKAMSYKANKVLITYMCSVLEDNRREAKELRNKQKVTYWFLVGLSTLMFLTGLTLITAPLWIELLRASETLNDIRWAGSAVAIGLGVADLYALYQLKPLARIQKLLGDISELTVILSKTQIGWALRMVQIDLDDRETVGIAAEHVEKIANDTLTTIEIYFEKWLDKDLNRDLQATTDEIN